MSIKTGNKAKQDTAIIDYGSFGIITSGTEVFSFEVAGSEKFAQPGVLPFYTNTHALIPMRIGNFDIVPHGEENMLPHDIRILLDENNLTPEILNKQAQLLWGQGPALYRQKFENGIRTKYFDTDPEIESWLKSWNYIDYLQKAVVEFSTMNGHFTKYFRNRGFRIGEPGFITKLEHVSCMFSRLEWPDQFNFINNIIVGDYAQPWKYGLRCYPVFSETDPFAWPVAMRYSNMYTFALSNDYSRSSFYGSMGWIRLATSIAKLLSNFNKNSAAIKYHIKVPAIYWERAETELQDKCSGLGVSYHSKMLVDFKNKKYKEFADILRGIENVGKFITTEEIFDETANAYVGWKVDVLDQKVKDYIDAQVNIAKQASLETTAGIGLHPALSNISFDGNLPSGSEQLYAFKLYLLTGVDIPESIVCRDINNAIAANFPAKDLKIGFYHDVVISESATAPADRVKNK
jgi:hypothetical protein